MRRTVLLVAFMLGATLLVAGAAFAVTRTCGGGECRGTNGMDTLYGSNMGETIFGLSGNDKIYGAGGADVLKGGYGTDFIKDGGGDNTIKGGLGRDVIRGGPGNETIRAGAVGQDDDSARDDIDCGGGTDTVYYTPGEDEFRNCETLLPTR